MTSVNAVQKGLKSLRRYYASDDKDLLRIVLNADSMFEANLAVGVLKDGDYELLVLADGNLCFDAALVADGVKIPWTSMPGYDDIVNQEFVDLVLSRKTVLKETVTFVQDTGVPLSPTFYMSMDDWNLEYVEDVLADMTKIF